MRCYVSNFHIFLITVFLWVGTVVMNLGMSIYIVIFSHRYNVTAQLTRALSFILKVIWTLFTPLILKVSLSFNILQFYYVAPRWELLFILLAVCKCSWIYYIIFFVILEMFLAIISSNSAPSPFSPFLDSNYVYLRPYHCALLAYWHFSCITKFLFFHTFC